MFQVFFGVKILTNAAVNAFLDGCSQISDSFFVLLQSAKACSDNLAGVVIPSSEDAILYKLLVVRT